MPRPPIPAITVNAASVASDSIAAGTGHVAAVFVGAIAAVLMPRLLGVAHFGHWVLFRTILLLASAATALGTMQIMSRFYAPLATTDVQEAGRLFKAIASARILFGAAAAIMGYVLLRLLGATMFDRTAALFLALAIMFRSMSITSSVLLYGATRIRRVAILHFLMAALVPLWVLGSYLLGGFASVPAACAMGEGLVMLASFGLARPHLAWPRGWPKRKRLMEILRFGSHVAPATLGAGAFMDIAVMLAALFGANESQMAFIGLAVRLQGMLLAGLLAINRAILPSLSVMAEQDGMDQSLRWVSLLCRMGSVLILGAVGTTAFIGRALIASIWGVEFIPALLPICLGLAATLPLWLTAIHMNLAMVIKRPDLQLRSVAWLYGGMVAVLFVVPGLQIPERTLFAIVAGSSTCMAAMILALRRHGCVCPHLNRLWVVTAVAMPPLVLIHHATDRIPLAAAWAFAFMATVLLSKCFRGSELIRVARYVVYPYRTVLSSRSNSRP